MYDRILVPLDGSAFAEQIIPHAVGLAEASGARVALLQIVESGADVSSAREYLQSRAERLGAEAKVVESERDVASAVLSELQRDERGLVAMTTHGRSGLMEAIAGSVALAVVRDAGRPVLLYRPRGTPAGDLLELQVRAKIIVGALDGSEFGETILNHATDLAIAAKARLTLVQVVPVDVVAPAIIPRTDVVESAYVHQQATLITASRPGLQVDWEVLHGAPGTAICDYVHGLGNAVLAMASHTRPGWERALLGSVAAECIRRADVPILVYHPAR